MFTLSREPLGDGLSTTRMCSELMCIKVMYVPFQELFKHLCAISSGLGYKNDSSDKDPISHLVSGAVCTLLRTSFFEKLVLL